MLRKKISNNSKNIDHSLNARILYYDFFASLFLYDLLSTRLELLKKQIIILKKYPLLEKDLLHFNFLEEELLKNGVKNFIFEYTYLFMLPFNADNNRKDFKSIILYLSFYLDETIAGKGLNIAKQLVKKSKVRLNDISFKENEEHLGFLFLFMKHLLKNNDFNLSKEVFNNCINIMQSKIIQELQILRHNNLYHHISGLLKTFMSLEFAIFN